MGCEECKSRKAASFAQYEGEAMRQHQTIKMLIVVILVLIILLVGSNIAWLYYESQLEESVTQTVEQEAETGTNNFIGGDIVGVPENYNNEKKNPENGR